VRLVLDTSVLVAAIRSKSGASRVLLHAALNSQFSLLISTPLVLEYEAVLTRHEHLKAAGIDDSEVGKLIDLICRTGIQVSLIRKLRPRLLDPDDEMVLETAVNGSADAIVTFNRGDFAGVAEEFGLEALTPQEALERMRNR
jgi:putative PIN family toxin of toxin-antitoxin system